MPKIERIKNRHLLKKKHQRVEIEKIESVIGTTVSLPDGARLEAGILDDGSRVMLLNGEILFFERDGRMLPTLRAVLQATFQYHESPLTWAQCALWSMVLM
ncbi:MAG: hypothetical protein ACP6IT_04655 [Candidatus Thorarchaeota archaeon]